MENIPYKMFLRADSPDFLDLPWDYQLSKWQNRSHRLEEAPKGISRHPVLFVSYDDNLYALKELTTEIAKKEFEVLMHLESLHLPAVHPVGYVQTNIDQKARSILITRYLKGSLPYRMLFMNPGLEDYQPHLLDAVASLLVQLHLSGFFWGDCSLSNTLFRRDAGALQAYLVDAETAERYTDYIPPAVRFYDLQIMEENIHGGLLDLKSIGIIPKFEPNIPLQDTGAYISLRYQELWEQINIEELINTDERYRIQERIRALNDLGFSVGDIELEEGENGNQLRLRVVVTDRNFHRDQLINLTGLDAEELQAQKMMNEIQEFRATLSQMNSYSKSLSEAASYWMENIYLPIVEQLAAMEDKHTTLPELYCQLLEHKWYLSEQSQYDVGHHAAADDFLIKFSAINNH